MINESHLTAFGKLKEEVYDWKPVLELYWSFLSELGLKMAFEIRDSMVLGKLANAWHH